jgi:hypothetical protein
VVNHLAGAPQHLHRGDDLPDPPVRLRRKTSGPRPSAAFTAAHSPKDPRSGHTANSRTPAFGRTRSGAAVIQPGRTPPVTALDRTPWPGRSPGCRSALCPICPRRLTGKFRTT